MSLRRQVLALAGLLCLACGVLAALAWRSVSHETAQAEARYRERASAVLEAGEEALLAAAKAQGGAVVTSQTLSQVPRSPRPSEAWETADLRAADLTRSQGALAAEAFVRAFAERAETEGRPADAAAALAAAGALALDARGQAGAGGRQRAQDCWEAILKLEPSAKAKPLYTRRGLRWRWIAELRLGEVEAAGGKGQRLVALLREIDAEGHEPLAQAVLRGRILATLRRANLGGGALSATLAADAERSLARRAQGEGVAPIRSWARTATEPAGFRLPEGPTRGALPEAREQVIALPLGEGRASLQTLEEVCSRALQAPELEAYRKLGFELRAGLGGSEVRAPVVARRVLKGLFEGVELQVLGLEREAFLAAERRRLRETRALIGGALLLLILGSAFVVRSLLREAETAKAQRNFVAAVTHELKTPLASIRLLGELLAEGGVEEPRSIEFAQRVVSEADRLSGLVTTVLDLSRVRGGVDPDRCEPFAPRDLAEEARERLRLPAEQAGATLEVRSGEDLPQVVGDREGLLGVLVNLLDNSLKYGDPAEPIELELARCERGVRFAVLDRGPGVPTGQEEQIFEAFHRAQDEMTREQPGVGLGLALARTVAEAHEGTLTYAARAGGGSRFLLELPAAS